METILDEMDDGVIILDHSDAVVYANVAAGRLLATTCDQLCGQPLPLSLPASRSAEIELTNLDTTLNLRIADVTWRAQPARLVLLRDISERKRAEESLRRSEEHYRVVAENIPDGDVALLDRDLRFLTAEGVNVHRMGRDRYIGRILDEVFDGDFLQFLKPICLEALAGEQGEGEYEIIGDDQPRIYRFHTVPIRDAQGRVYAVLTLSQDITKLKLSERAVSSLNDQLQELFQREQQARADIDSQRALLRSVLDLVPALVGILMGPALVYQYANANYCKLVGRPEAAFIGKTMREGLPEIAAMGIHPILERVYRTGEPFHVVERLYHFDWNGDGVPEETYLTASYQAIRDESGSVVGILVHAYNVTDSMLARRAVEQQTREIAQLNRELEERVAERTAQLQELNAELETFAHSVSHDLRAPLRRIDGFSQALIEDCGDRLSAEGRHYLARICVASQQMRELIDDLLALSRGSRLDVQVDEVDLSAMAREILAVLQEQSPERQVALTIAPSMRVRGDRSFLWIALENLLGNAWKFTSKTQGAAIEIGVEAHGTEQVFFVRDNGAGFDPAYRDKLFSTFFRLHSPAEFPGTGIGLATVKRVIERHGGRIWAEGAVNQGATFYFTLPAP